MSAYISVELQQQIRNRFANCYTYCLTVELLTARYFFPTTQLATVSLTTSRSNSNNSATS